MIRQQIKIQLRQIDITLDRIECLGGDYITQAEMSAINDLRNILYEELLSVWNINTEKYNLS